MTTTISTVGRIGVALAFTLIGMGQGFGTANADDVPKAKIDEMRKALEKYKDPYVAMSDISTNWTECMT